MAWLWDGVEDQDQAQHQSQRQPTALSAPHEQRKRPRSFLNVAFILCRQLPTLPHTFACSTIGPAGLNLRRFAGVSEAEARSRNPERSRGISGPRAAILNAAERRGRMSHPSTYLPCFCRSLPTPKIVKGSRFHSNKYSGRTTKLT